MVVNNPLIRLFISWVALGGYPYIPAVTQVLFRCGFRLPDTMLTLAALKNIPKDILGNAKTKHRLVGLIYVLGSKLPIISI